jgi:signal transduction histidine kinase
LRSKINAVVFAACALSIYLALLLLALEAARRWVDLDLIWIGLFFSAILALLAQPVLDRLRKYIEKPPENSQQKQADLLRQYSQSITNTLDIHLLSTLAVGTASEYLEIRRGSLFLVESEDGSADQGTYIMRGAKGMGDSTLTPGRFRRESPLATFFRSEARPITHVQLSALARNRDISVSENDWLASLGAEVYVPIFSKNEWIGLLALGPKNSGESYTPQELTFLSTLAGQTAVALENTRLVDHLVRLNEEFRRAYQALDQANEHLERWDKTKSDFLAIVSHELRTPLTLISGAGQMLLDDSELQKNSYYKKVLANLKTGMSRLEKIIESMLDMARIDTRLMDLELQPVSILSLMRMVHEDLKEDAKQRKQVIEFCNLEELSPVMADLPALRKVFYNLVVNAIKYTPDGGEITIRGQTVAPDGGELPVGGVEIVVSDTGIGIAPEYRDLIFMKFYQGGDAALHSSGRTKFKAGGPGLGLSIARGIVEAHQGWIWVESPGYNERDFPGSHFHVMLPLRPVEKPTIK